VLSVSLPLHASQLCSSVACILQTAQWAQWAVVCLRLHATLAPWPCRRPSVPAGPRRKKFGATVDATLALAAQLAALPPGATVETQDAMKRVTLVRAQPAQRMSFRAVSGAAELPALQVAAAACDTAWKMGNLAAHAPAMYCLGCLATVACMTGLSSKCGGAAAGCHTDCGLRAAERCRGALRSPRAVPAAAALCSSRELQVRPRWWSPFVVAPSLCSADALASTGGDV